MSRFRTAIFSLDLLAPLAQAAIPVTHYKSPTCGCCEEYVKYLKANGFEVNAINSNDMNRIKQEKRMGNNLASCHTALIGGHAVEDHVPVVATQKLLRNKPAIIGISAPGMPANSRGMDVIHPGTLTIYAIERNATASAAVFSIE